LTAGGIVGNIIAILTGLSFAVSLIIGIPLGLILYFKLLI